MAPVLELVAKDYQGKVNVYGMNVDVAPDTASNLGIMAIPATVFFKGGKEVGRIAGAPKKEKFAEEIKRLFGI